MELEFDENKIPTQSYIINNSKILKNKPLYKTARNEVKVSKDLHQTIEFFSVFASAIGTAMYIQGSIPYANEFTNMIFIVSIVFGFYVGKVIAQGQQKLFSNLLESVGIRAMFGAFVMWAFLISLDVALMGSGSVAVSQAVQEQKFIRYEGAKLEKKKSDALSKIKVIDMQIKELEDEKRESETLKSEAINTSSLAKEREEKVNLLREKLRLNFEKDQKRIYRIWNKAGGTSNFGSEKSEKRASKKRYEARLKREVEALKRSLKSKHNKLIKDSNKALSNYRKKIKDITLKIKSLTDEKAKIDIPTLSVPIVHIDKKLYFGIPFFIAIFLSLLDMWKISVAKKFDTYTKKQATEIRNEIILSRGFNPETYSKRADEERQMKRKIEEENRREIKRKRRESELRNKRELEEKERLKRESETVEKENKEREFEELIKEDREAIEKVVNYYKEHGHIPSLRTLGEMRNKSHSSSVRLYKKYPTLFSKESEDLPYTHTKLFETLI